MRDRVGLDVGVCLDVGDGVGLVDGKPKGIRLGVSDGDADGCGDGIRLGVSDGELLGVLMLSMLNM